MMAHLESIRPDELKRLKPGTGLQRFKHYNEIFSKIVTEPLKTGNDIKTETARTAKKGKISPWVIGPTSVHELAKKKFGTKIIKKTCLDISPFSQCTLQRYGTCIKICSFVPGGTTKEGDTRTAQ